MIAKMHTYDSDGGEGGDGANVSRVGEKAARGSGRRRVTSLCE